jgi:2-dehydropantoate 2-reductase
VTDLVVGSGAVGTLMAWALAAGGRDVALVRRRHDGPPSTVELVALDRDGKPSAARVTELSSTAALAAVPEVIVFAVKMFDLEAAAASCSAWPDVPGLTVSNGVGAEEIVAAARPAAGLIAGSVTASVERTDDGGVQRLNRGGVALAKVRGDVDTLVGELAAAFAAAGLPVARFDDAAAMKWSKLVANLVANASSAIVDLPPAAIYGDPDGFRVERRQLLEALAVIRRLGLRPVALPGANVRLLAAGIRLPTAIVQPILGRVVARARGGKDPSLRLNAQASAADSEVRWLNGAVAGAAERLGGSAPVNRRLAELVERVLADPKQREWFRGRLDRLAAVVEGGEPAATAA